MRRSKAKFNPPRTAEQSQPAAVEDGPGEEFRQVMERMAAEAKEEKAKLEARAAAQQATTEAYVRSLGALASAVEHLASQLDKLAYPPKVDYKPAEVKVRVPAGSISGPRAERQPQPDPATPAKSVPDRKMVGAALVALTKAKGPDAAFDVLERHGAKTLSDLPVEKYAAVLDAALTAGVTK